MWFQNRRAKWRKRQKLSNGRPGPVPRGMRLIGGTCADKSQPKPTDTTKPASNLGNTSSRPFSTLLVIVFPVNINIQALTFHLEFQFSIVIQNSKFNSQGPAITSISGGSSLSTGLLWKTPTMTNYPWLGSLPCLSTSSLSLASSYERLQQMGLLGNLTSRGDQLSSTNLPNSRIS